MLLVEINVNEIVQVIHDFLIEIPFDVVIVVDAQLGFHLLLIDPDRAVIDQVE